MFWRLFERSVDRLHIDAFKKHIYLLGCLPYKTPARKAIELYPPSDENYQRVVDILKKRFGESKAIVESLQAELLNLSKPGDSIHSLRAFTESIERVCLQLVDFGENEQNKFMASTIKSKLPFSILTQVVEKERASGHDFSCLDIRQALQDIVDVKEEVQRCAQVFRGEERSRHHQSTHQSPHRSSGQWQNPRPINHFNRSQPSRYSGRNASGRTPQQDYRSFPAINTSHNEPAREGPRTPKCSLCDHIGHRPSQCPKYPTAGARRRRLAEQNRCVNCLFQGHNVEQCDSDKRCLNCGEKHHFIICSALEKAPPQQKHLSRPRPDPRQKGRGGDKSQRKQAETKPSHSHLLTATESGPTEEKQPKQATDLIVEEVKTDPATAEAGVLSTEIAAVTVNGKKPHAFLMTRRVMVASKRDRRISFQVPVLFDPGSQTSYISDSLLKKLRPPKVTSEEMEVHGFGGKRQEPMRFHSPVYSILLRRTDSKWEELLLNRTEQISTPFGMVEWTSDEPVTEDEEVRDAMTYTREEPEILISARHFWKFFNGTDADHQRNRALLQPRVSGDQRRSRRKR
jgi:hypothetical protein